VNVVFGRAREINLQATLSSSSALGNDEAHAVRPHHPITCDTTLRLEPDGALICDHAAAPGDDERTRVCVNHSLALLLMELALEL
jgi:hypothetical protein